MRQTGWQIRRQKMYSEISHSIWLQHAPLRRAMEAREKNDPTVFKMGMVFYGQTFQASESNTVIIQSSQQGQGLFWKPILMIVTPSVPKKNKASLTTYTGNIEFQHSGLSECSATSWWETNRLCGKSKTPIAKVFWEAHSYYICCSCNFASLLDFLGKKKKHTLKITIIANHPQTFQSPNHTLLLLKGWLRSVFLYSQNNFAASA